MTLRTTCSAALLFTAFSTALASGGSNDPWKTEVDCGGIYAGGDTVDYILEIEDRSNQSHDITYTFELVTPSGQSRQLASGNYTIGRNQSTFLNRALRLPANARNGRYQFIISASSATENFSDTCSFHVQ